MKPIDMAHALAGAAFDAWQDIEGRTDLADDVAMGADGTATSRGDQLVERAMLDEAAAIGVNVLSEEAGRIDHGSPLTAVIDPIDGTRNASRGIPFFCTSVAIGAGSMTGTQAGVVMNLVTADIYAATAGRGATCNGDDIRRRPFDADDVTLALIADYADLPTVERMQQKSWHIRDLGSAALELCLVGTGALDGFHVPKNWLRVIDIAAGTLFAREAGGRVVAPGTDVDLDMAYDLIGRTGLTAVHDPAALGHFGVAP